MSVRQEKVNKFLVEEISAVIRKMKDPRLGFVTVTGAKVSSDMRIAEVGVSVYGDEGERKKMVDVLESASGYIRNQISRSAHMKIIPVIKFHLDEGAIYSARIQELLLKIKNEQAGQPDS